MKRQYAVPGIEAYPDLVRRFNYEISKLPAPGCNINCDGPKIVRKYVQEVKNRQPKPR